jgi:hypothetical protein
MQLIRNSSETFLAVARGRPTRLDRRIPDPWAGLAGAKSFHVDEFEAPLNAV